MPLEEIEARVHELPPRDRPLFVVDDDPRRVERALALLRERGFAAAPAPAGLSARPLVAGSQRVRLWEPNAFVAECLPEVLADLREPASRGRVARPASAIDLAAGSGRDAVFLAQAGMRVLAVDILPDALERARDLARREGVALETRRMDLERDPFPEGERWDLVLVVNYLQRSLFEAIRRAVAPGGFVIYETFLERQRDLFGKPANPAHLLAPGELRGYFEGWEVRRDREGLAAPRRFVASLFARKPPSAEAARKR